MLDQAGAGRTRITAALEAPLGRGVNFYSPVRRYPAPLR